MPHSALALLWTCSSEHTGSTWLFAPHPKQVFCTRHKAFDPVAGPTRQQGASP